MCARRNKILPRRKGRKNQKIFTIFEGVTKLKHSHRFGQQHKADADPLKIMLQFRDSFRRTQAHFVYTHLYDTLSRSTSQIYLRNVCFSRGTVFPFQQTLYSAKGRDKRTTLRDPGISADFPNLREY